MRPNTAQLTAGTQNWTGADECWTSGLSTPKIVGSKSVPDPSPPSHAVLGQRTVQVTFALRGLRFSSWGSPGTPPPPPRKYFFVSDASIRERGRTKRGCRLSSLRRCRGKVEPLEDGWRS